MNHTIDPGNVKWAVSRLMAALDGGQFSTAEVVLALAETTGRTIVQLADTPVAGFQCAAAMGQHLKDTLIAGYSSKGFDMGDK